MRRTGLGTVIVMLVSVLVVTSAALASSVHLKGGPKAKPAFSDNGLTLSTSSALAGLGNTDVVVRLSATGNPTATCTNPSGQNQPPGQNPAPVTLTGSESIPASETKNGNVSFNVTTSAPTSPVSGAPDCPNVQWTEDITDVAFTSATISIEQPPGTVVLTVVCAFTTPTENGTVPSRNVTCTSS